MLPKTVFEWALLYRLVVPASYSTHGFTLVKNNWISLFIPHQSQRLNGWFFQITAHMLKTQSR